MALSNVQDLKFMNYAFHLKTTSFLLRSWSLTKTS